MSSWRGDVREHIDAGNQPDDGQLRAFTLAVLEGVEELHRASVVHRDLKPDNIILLNGDWTKPVIIDLGLARLIDLTTVTVYPWIGGTWTYMAPEQLRAERAFDRTDIWAVAVIVAELASGQHPFWRGEPHPPADWHGRLQAGMTIPGSVLRACVIGCSWPAHTAVTADPPPSSPDSNLNRCCHELLVGVRQQGGPTAGRFRK